VSEPTWECFKGGVDAVVRRHVQVDDVGSLVRPLCAVVPRRGAIVVEVDPLGLLVEPIADWDVEVGDFAIVECVAGWGLIERVFIVKDTLLQVAEPVFIAFGGDAGTGLLIGDGL
jgi:hypothetical protein